MRRILDGSAPCAAVTVIPRIKTRRRTRRKYNRPMALLSGKKILVTGVLSNRSIAYGIAKAARREGAEIALTYQNERFKDRVTEMRSEEHTSELQSQSK